MAGIAGYFGQALEPEVLQSMVRKLAHRGRGGEAFYLADPVFMGIRGGAADSGTQPAYSQDESVAVLFSGNIGNYSSLREELASKGATFRNDGVAELVLRMYETYGLNLSLHLRGGFVFAVHDKLRDLVLLCRDKMGCEPLYYTTTQSGTFAFASEVKALLEHPGVQVTPDLSGIDAYLSLGHSPGPDSFFKGIHKLPAGHRLIWNPGLHVMTEPYWQWEGALRPDPSLKSDDDFQQRFNAQLEDAVRQAAGGLNKPGLSLSGAVEETAIAACLAKETGRGFEAFGVGYADGDPALAPAREIAARLGMRHHEVICTPPDMEKLPEIVWALDEPTADPAVLPFFMMAQRAGQSTDGLLRGLGADELMYGLLQQECFLRLSAKPPFLAGICQLGIRALPLSWLNGRFDCGGHAGEACRARILSFLSELRKGSGFMRRYTLLSSVFTARDKSGLYGETMSPFMEKFIDARRETPDWPSPAAFLLEQQKNHGLQDGVLADAGKMAALSSTVLRLPFMDPVFVEGVIGAPGHMKFRDGLGKSMFRRYVESVQPGLPEASRRQTTLPLDRFMSARVMRDMAETCLSEKAVSRRGLFNPAAVRALVAQSRGGDMIVLRQVFSLIMLELWFRIYVDREKGWAG